MSIKVLYLPKNFYTSPKQISGYAPGEWLLLFAGQIVFQTTDMKPIAILSLRVELQPHTVSQTFRFNHPEHSIMKKSIRVPPLHSLARQYACRLVEFSFVIFYLFLMHWWKLWFCFYVDKLIQNSNDVRFWVQYWGSVTMNPTCWLSLELYCVSLYFAVHRIMSWPSHGCKMTVTRNRYMESYWVRRLLTAWNRKGKNAYWVCLT